MENFDVVQALIKTALQGDRSAVEHQIGRLVERLKDQGDAKDSLALRRLVSRAAQVQNVEPIEVTMSQVEPNALRTLRPLRLTTALPVDQGSGAVLCEVVFPSGRLSSPVLESDALAAVDSLLREWSNQALLMGEGLFASSSLLLYGPPGTGKTSLAVYLSSRLGLPAVVARLDGLISSYLGSTARNLASLFDFANAHDCVLVLDEFDAVAKVRDDPNEVGEIKRVVNAVLQNLDRRHEFGLTIAITNHESLLDAAIWRRFEHQIRLSMPSQPSRRAIIQHHFSRSGISPALEKMLAWATADRSGADVRTLAIATRKNLILQNQDGVSPVQALRFAAAALGSRVDPRLLELGESGDAGLARTLSAEADLTGSELGELFTRDRRTIVRWLHDESAREDS